MADRLHVVALLMLLFGAAGCATTRPEIGEIGVSGGVNRTRAREAPARMRAGVSGIAPLREDRALAVHLEAALSQRGYRQNLGWFIYDPDLEYDKRESYAEFSLLARANFFGPPRGRFSLHFLLGPVLAVPLRCRREKLDTGAREVCFGSSGVSVTAGGGMGIRMSERLDLTVELRHGTGYVKLSWAADRSIDKHSERSLLAGVTYRRK